MYSVVTVTDVIQLCFFSVFLDDTTRAAMGEQAVAMAKAVGYDSAGRKHTGQQLLH